jgi:imidazolonepropionase-like amidohydrolase
MRAVTLLLPLLLLFNQPAWGSQQSGAPTATSLALTHVTVIDTAGGPPRGDMTVVITGDRITAVATSAGFEPPLHTQIVDATGKYLIPGLWDMHVHVLRRERLYIYFPLLIANGVTGVRDMGSGMSLDGIVALRQQIAAGTMLGPRLVAAGPVVDGPKFTGADIMNVATVEQARAAVASLQAAGMDFVKVYDNLSRESYFAIADAAKKLDFPLTGHVPFAVTAREASDAGQRSIEHSTGVLLACSTEERELTRRYGEAAREPDFSLANILSIRADIRAADTLGKERCAELLQRFRKNGTWQCPTLVVQRFAFAYDPERMPRDRRLAYIPAAWRKRWAPESWMYTKSFTAEDRAGTHRLYQTLLELVGTMRREGVDLLAGTDLQTPYNFPGFSLHDELALLVEGGLTPLEALQTATINPARFLHRLDTLGTVERGKLADLVVLAANPLEDIHNTQKIAGVVVGGRYLPEAELQKMLADVEVAAAKH